MSSNKSYVSEDILNKFTDNQSIRFNDRYFVTWIEINEQLFNHFAISTYVYYPQYENIIITC